MVGSVRGRWIQIYRSQNETSGFKKVATVKGDSTVTYTDSGLEAGTDYYYKVRAYSGSKTGKYSSVLGASPLAVGTLTSVKSDGSGALTVKWGAVPEASGYQLYRSTSEDGKYTKIADVKAAILLYGQRLEKGRDVFLQGACKGGTKRKDGIWKLFRSHLRLEYRGYGNYGSDISGQWKAPDQMEIR